MKQLTEEQITNNWKRLRSIINETFTGERCNQLNEMYDHFENRMVMAPASGKEHFHNARVGGYVEHVLHIIDMAKDIKDVWEKNGANINFTDEELVFSAMHHDLGKVGDLENDYYVINESEWHRKNQGTIYNHNPKLQYMTVTDRAIFILNHFGIKMTEWEYIGLRLTDGLYEEANTGYLKSYNKDYQLKSNLPHILHQADMMATHIEYDVWKYGQKQDEKKVQSQVNSIHKTLGSKPNTTIKKSTTITVNEEMKERSKDLFSELFGDKK